MKNHKAAEGISSYLGPQTSIEGIFTFWGMAQISGRIKGEIRSEEGRLMIAKTGEVEAGIAAGEVVVNGRVKGTIRAARKIEIFASAHVVGDIYAPEIYIDPKADFCGKCYVGAEEDEAGG